MFTYSQSYQTLMIIGMFLKICQDLVQKPSIFYTDRVSKFPLMLFLSQNNTKFKSNLES